jgi:hypothetical protein
MSTGNQPPPSDVEVPPGILEFACSKKKFEKGTFDPSRLTRLPGSHKVMETPRKGKGVMKSAGRTSFDRLAYSEFPRLTE